MRGAFAWAAKVNVIADRRFRRGDLRKILQARSSLFLRSYLFTMSVATDIKSKAKHAIAELYETQVDDGAITINLTKPEFEGDYTIVLFNLLKLLKRSPDVLGNELGSFLMLRHPEVFQS